MNKNKMYNVIIGGCGITGAVIARNLAENLNLNVLILEKRKHIGGNMYDYVNEQGILVQKYGPHIFRTGSKRLYDYMCKYATWDEFHVTGGVMIDGKCTPSPFNYQTIDDFFETEEAQAIKVAIEETYPEQETATVLDMLNSENILVKKYADFLYEKDYSLYTAKQWGISPEEIDPSVLKRVPIRFNYKVGYFDEEYQVLPHESYTHFFENLLNHPNIEVRLECDFKDVIHLDEENGRILYDNQEYSGEVVYTGALDELLNYRYGQLPYRSLRFDWKTEEVKNYQDEPIVAYPQADGFTRITEYTKLPVQEVGEKTTYAVEYPIPYIQGMEAEPYYPVLTEESSILYEKYVKNVDRYKNLHLCGRLADFKYYYMDQALERALDISEKLEKKLKKQF